MKKKLSIILFLMLTASIMSCLTGCKTRHVVTSKTEVNSTTFATSSTKKDSVSIDTGKIKTDVKTAKNVSDSSVVIITPDSGKTETIKIAADGQFSYIGAAKKIVFKKKLIDKTQSDSSSQVNKGLTTKTTEADSSTKKQTVHKETKVKTTDSKPSYGWIPWAAAALLILGLSVYLFFKFKV